LAIIGKDINRARAILEQEGLVGIPTETVYGLAGNALSEKAVSNIFLVKNRPSFDPLIVHVSGVDALLKYSNEIPDLALKLVEHFWPGPLTLLLPKKEVIPDLVTSGFDRAGFRCPRHPMALELLSNLTFPLAAPSANPFGYISPTTAEHVQLQLGNQLDYILDGGPCEVGLESTIIGFDQDQPIIHRLGGIEIDSIERIIGKVSHAQLSNNLPQAPGQLTSHYAPRKKMVVGDIAQLISNHSDESFGILSFSTDYQIKNQRILSPTGDTLEAAKNLFRYMRELDQSSAKLIFAEWVPESGLGAAINDRLRRASA